MSILSDSRLGRRGRANVARRPSVTSIEHLWDNIHSYIAENVRFIPFETIGLFWHWRFDMRPFSIWQFCVFVSSCATLRCKNHSWVLRKGGLGGSGFHKSLKQMTSPSNLGTWLWGWWSSSPIFGEGVGVFQDADISMYVDSDVHPTCHAHTHIYI